MNNQKTSIIGRLHELVDFNHLLIMGGFNFPTIIWAEGYCAGSDSSAAFSFLIL